MQQAPNKQQGSIIVTILVIMIFLSTLLFALFVLADSNLSRAGQRIFLLQAQYAAESGADAAIATLNSGNDTYTGTTSDVQVIANDPRYRATYSVSVAAGSSGKEKIITATGKLYMPSNKATPTYTRKIEVVAQRTSTTTSSAMLSRNIIEMASSVKEVKGQNVFVNNYIKTDKNVNDIMAENITVAGRDSGAGNCSIEGPGTLTKPASFSTPGQTKTKLTLAYNNCITPPGNTSNANFDVSPSQTNITKVQSTYLPWSQYMDASYQNSPTGCSDWTGGSSPRSIPSTGNDKKTHYPDSSSGVATSCGTSGTLNLGSSTYTIKGNVHVRANLCGSSGCNPTFNNPDSTTKYVFVEGTVNFTGLASSAGSGPIVFVVYGADPASLASVCPLGGAVYMGQSGSNQVNAPAIYLLAVNGGVCFDKTKFAVNPALGGASGKNLYIATNSGTPFDLSFNTSFPTSDIPVDLSWKAARYRRL
jgi:hypothetical protein